MDLDLFLDKPSPRFVQTFGETRIFLIGHTRVLAQVGRRVARFMYICVYLSYFFTQCNKSASLITCKKRVLAPETRHFDVKQVSYVRM